MKNSILSIVLSGMLVGVGTFLLIAKKTNGRLNEALRFSQLKSDSLSGDKKELRAKLEQLKKRFDSLSESNHVVQISLSKSRAQLAIEDFHLISLTRSFEEMNKKCDGFLNLQKQWDKERAELVSSDGRFQSENKSLTAQVATLTEANQRLNTELAYAKLFEKDNISIARLDKHAKPIVKARKIKKIKVSMSLPSEMNSPVFKIYDSNGKLLPDIDGTFTSNFSNENNVFGNKAARLDLTYLLSKKINSGSYRVEIATNEGKHIGNLFMNLR